MARSWGDSWGASWGDSWGSSAPVGGQRHCANAVVTNRIDGSAIVGNTTDGVAVLDICEGE